MRVLHADKRGVRRTSEVILWAVFPAALLPMCAAPSESQSQQKRLSEQTELLEANPNRPSDSNSANLLDPGVLQLEYGWSREWVSQNETQSTIDGEFRFGLARNIEVRWGGNPWIRDATASATNQGFGDQYLSAQLRLTQAGDKTPAIAFSYLINLPAADERKNLGSGRVDNSFTFLVSKDVHHFTCDFNAAFNVLGRAAIPGHDHNAEFFLAFQHTISRGFSVISEWGGETRLSPTEDPFATNLWAVSFQAHRKVVLDIGFEDADTPGGPPKRVFFGMTYVLADLRGARGDTSQTRIAIPETDFN
jgi:hypothetical protein